MEKPAHDVILPSPKPEPYRRPLNHEFCRLARSFQAWAATRTASSLQVGVECAKKTVIYDFDGLRYKSTVKTQWLEDEGVDKLELNVKLPNFGFLGRDSSELMIRRYWPSAFQPLLPEWVLLHRLEYEDAFAPIFRWASQFLGDLEKFEAMVRYSSITSSVDIRVLDRSTQRVVAITFEPRYPEERFEDGWDSFSVPAKVVKIAGSLK